MSMHIGHVALRVTDLDAALQYTERALGLGMAVRDSGEALLSANEKHHELQLLAGDVAGFDHVGLEVSSDAEVLAIREKALGAGATSLDSEHESGIAGARARFAGPGGIVYEVYHGMDRKPLTVDGLLRPRITRLGHLTFLSDEVDAVVAFWTDVLGFRISDRHAGLVWARCDADHHGLAVGPRPEGTVLHHHAWQVPDFSALGRYCDVLASRDIRLDWGPVRHGPGANLAVYLPDWDGAVIEVYTEMLQIRDDESYVAVDWTDEPFGLNLWGPMPDPALFSAGIPVGAIGAPT